MKYLKARQGNVVCYVAKTAAQKVLGKDYEVVAELSGTDLVGLEYEGPFDRLQAVRDSGAREQHRVIAWKDVGEEEGTGLVHIAPGCGKEDFELGRELKLAAISPLDEFGVFVDGFGEYSGKAVQESSKMVVSELARRGLLYKTEKYLHRYPVCWRCQSELVYRLVAEWFISMGEKLGRPLEDITAEERKKKANEKPADNSAGPAAASSAPEPAATPSLFAKAQPAAHSGDGLS
jgi:isoleucyl-tRNA synthetase